MANRRAPPQLDYTCSGPDDYARLEAMVEDLSYTPCYDTFLAAQAQMDEEAFFKTSVPACPCTPFSMSTWASNALRSNGHNVGIASCDCTS